MREDDHISLLNYIEWQVENGKYSRSTMEPVIKYIKREIKKIFLEADI
jgi:hypothetical protein